MISKSLGLDLGSKTCGVAISDGLGMYAHPFETLKFTGNLKDLVEPMREIIETESIQTIALGDPKMMNNDIGERALISREFKNILEKEFSLPVTLIDERLTSLEANKQLISLDVSRKNRKKVIDQLAAVNILQTYLDQKRYMEGK